MAYFEPTRVPV